ncbi:hypothetical protein HPC49_44125 [Pyxidicoccus fallax]|uniref:Uncharacterized protein n=1 Tax=Pyxidicoccus fallax TaxID=394095 RepID=A0A848LXU9_9BACT|nr:hypothetical protein [Pyxidicoccus fallax]NMO22895.1 hypothetical protein [Pyxidicoccus fallax]NPC85173.1 hypothetical protein [Pyxidicoccus fallax]
MAPKHLLGPVLLQLSLPQVCSESWRKAHDRCSSTPPMTTKRQPRKSLESNGEMTRTTRRRA